ncbi:hypothetical protein SKAU_G00332760 [Synaphobranchus kaupii]|uniref:SCAN box domain-containing protein n=1 Tax=Synaphobranchus kaupii TaxID=118154 RepID=A0A9Q1ELF1_SYNKA|nr:hypothetical protein SKAU_G00332760 [Synaphobranchus kaupii]
MEFNLDAFAEAPTLEQLDSCGKADLLLIADHFAIEVTRSGRKQVIKDRVKEVLLEQQMLVGADTGESVLGKAESSPVKTKCPVTAAQQKFELDMRRLELEAQTALRERELEAQARERVLEAQVRLKEREMEMNLRLKEMELETARVSSGCNKQQAEFDVSRHIRMVPPFREAEVEKYFSLFERVAITLKWPKDAWSLLLQCVLVGKAQDAYSSLPLEQSLDYEEAKAAVLRAYELVPEAYRQKFRRFRKADSQTFVEFAREKESMFDRWCAAQGVKQFEQLRDLMIMEEFKNCLPERVATYLNKQKVTQVAMAAVLADEFSLTHASLSVGKPPPRHNDVTPRREFPGSSAGPLKASAPVSGAGQETSGNKGKVLCHFCKKPGHIMVNCYAFKKKNNFSKGVTLVKTSSPVLGLGLSNWWVVPTPIRLAVSRRWIRRLAILV